MKKVTKSVVFNLENKQDKALFKLLTEDNTNFSGKVKEIVARNSEFIYLLPTITVDSNGVFTIKIE